jgi:hypothetical protein
MGDIWTALGKALDRQAATEATQASIDAVRGESDGGELVDGYNCVDRGIEKKERDNQRKRGYGVANERGVLIH